MTLLSHPVFYTRKTFVDNIPQSIITTVAGSGSWGSGGDGGGGAPTSAPTSGGGSGDAPTSGGVSLTSSPTIGGSGGVLNYGSAPFAPTSGGGGSSGVPNIAPTSGGGVSPTSGGGGSAPNNGGDGGAATSSQLNNPYGISVDEFENIFIADENNHKIRMVTRAGIITTFAGTGVTGSGGDGGAAIHGQLYYPQGVAVDIISGFLYIADTGNNKIRVVTKSTGLIKTFAGSSSSYYSYSNTYNCAATSAYLVNPAAVAVDSVGNVYIGTGNPYGSNNNQVLVVTHGTRFITLFAGCHSCYSYNNVYGGPATSTSLNAPTGIAVDVHFNVYIATASYYYSYNQVLVITHGTGMISVFAGTSSYNGAPNYGDGGPATSAILRYPSGVCVDGNGNVYISDQQSNNVRLVTNGTRIITTYAGGGSSFGSLGDGGPATSAHLSSPNGVAVDVQGRNVFIADTSDLRIRKVTNSIDYPTSQPSGRPSTPSFEPSVLPTGEPSKYVWQPKLEEVGALPCYVYVMYYLVLLTCLCLCDTLVDNSLIHTHSLSIQSCC